MVFNDERGRTLPTVAVGSGSYKTYGACQAYRIQKILLKRFEHVPSIMSRTDSIRNSEMVKYEKQLLSCHTISEFLEVEKYIKQKRQYRHA